jgi:hypothetical protein
MQKRKDAETQRKIWKSLQLCPGVFGLKICAKDANLYGNNMIAVPV